MVTDPHTWHRIVTLDGCLVHPNPGDCDGRVEAHHVITRQQLRKRGLADLTWDTRNGMGLCTRAHTRHTGALERVPRRLVPAHAEQFAREHALTHLLDRYYPNEERTAA